MRWLIFVLSIAWLAAPTSGLAAAPATRESVADGVAASPDLRHRASFTVTCSETTWTKVLDHPWLMGQLWTAYGHSPAYRVRTAGDGLHVDDPTGLTGDVFIVRKTANERRYLTVGHIQHRAVPFFNGGQAVAILRSEPVGRQIRGTLDIYVRADRAIGRVVLWAGTPLLRPRVENRIHLNLRDAVQIVEQVASSPEDVLRRLQGPAAETFRAVFVPPKPTPPIPAKRPKAPKPRSPEPRR